MGYTPSSQGSPTFCGFSLPGSRGPRVLCPAQDDHSWIVGAAPSGPVRQSLQSQEGPIMDSVGRGRAVRLRVGGGDPQAWWAQPIMGPQDPQGPAHPLGWHSPLTSLSLLSSVSESSSSSVSFPSLPSASPAACGCSHLSPCGHGTTEPTARAAGGPSAWSL